MDPFTIAGLIATVGGAFVQQQAADAAARRQQQAIRESLERQRQLQMEAERAAMSRAQEFAPEDRQAEQSKIADQMTTEFVAPIEQAAAREVAPPVQGDVSSDYTATRAKSMAEQAKAADALARLFGRIGSASQLRQNEAVRLGDTATQIGMLNNFSRGQSQADQYGINAAGVPDGGAMLAGTILQGVGTAGVMGAFDGLKGAAGAGNVWGGAPAKDLSNLKVGKGFSLGGSL